MWATEKPPRELSLRSLEKKEIRLRDQNAGHDPQFRTCDCACDPIFALTSPRVRGGSTAPSTFLFLRRRHRSKSTMSSVCSGHTTCVLTCVSAFRTAGPRLGFQGRAHPIAFRTPRQRSREREKERGPYMCYARTSATTVLVGQRQRRECVGV